MSQVRFSLARSIRSAGSATEPAFTVQKAIRTVVIAALKADGEGSTSNGYELWQETNRWPRHKSKKSSITRL